jgi:heme/copper-type cytochrome/quinol oxidase subunit 2
LIRRECGVSFNNGDGREANVKLLCDHLCKSGSNARTEIVDLHALVLGICIVIAAVVFRLMFYSIVRFRKAAGREAKQFHSNTTLGIAWTVIPCLIIAGMAYPATKTVSDMHAIAEPAARLCHPSQPEILVPHSRHHARVESAAGAFTGLKVLDGK